MRGGDNRTGELFSYVDLEARARHDHPLQVVRMIVNEALDARRCPQRHHLMEGGLQRSPTTLGPRQHATGRVRHEIHSGKTGRTRQLRTLPQTGGEEGLRSPVRRLTGRTYCEPKNFQGRWKPSESW